MSWIAHVKKVAAEKGISYSVALKSAETKEGYTKVERKALTSGRQVVESGHRHIDLVTHAVAVHQNLRWILF